MYELQTSTQQSMTLKREEKEDQEPTLLDCLTMSVNSSGNDSLHSQASSPILCFDVIIGWYMYTALILTNVVVLLPLSIFVLYLGFQRFKKQRRVSSAAVVSFSDFVTYNLAVMELIGVLGNAIALCGNFIHLPVMMWVGFIIAVFPWNGQMFFPVLTCVERYLAVVHPITYLRLRQGGGVRIRNITTMYIWLQCFAVMGSMFLMINYFEFAFILSTCLMALFLIAMTFSSLSVLCVLTRPRPGEVGRDGVRVDQSKQRAFHKCMIIMGVLLLRFGGNLVCSVVGLSKTVSPSAQCVVNMFSGWFNLPSSLVLPLLFLHRARKGARLQTQN